MKLTLDDGTEIELHNDPTGLLGRLGDATYYVSVLTTSTARTPSHARYETRA